MIESEKYNHRKPAQHAQVHYTALEREGIQFERRAYAWPKKSLDKQGNSKDLAGCPTCWPL